MTMRLKLVAIIALLSSAPSIAHHLDNLEDPFESRGECEAATADLDNVDREGLLARFPDLFSTRGDTRAFITRAFTCEQADDGMWYITDHLVERLESGWFQRRQK